MPADDGSVADWSGKQREYFEEPLEDVIEELSEEERTRVEALANRVLEEGTSGADGTPTDAAQELFDLVGEAWTV